MTNLTIEEAFATRQAKERREREMQDYVGSLLDERALAYIAEYFRCNSPAFLPTDNFNHDAAMIRDAHRAVYLTLRHWRRQYKKK